MGVVHMRPHVRRSASPNTRTMAGNQHFLPDMAAGLSPSWPMCSAVLARMMSGSVC